MLTYGDNTYTYTVNGSLLTKTNAEGVTEYSYDAMGNLLRVVLPDNRVITYQIDARGRRIGKKIDGVFVYGFIYGNQLNPIAKVDESGNIVEQYVYGLKSNIPEYIIKDGKKYKIISNHLGSPIMVLGGQTQDLPVLQMKYDSFGNIIEQNGNFEIPFRFAGGLYDKDTKLTRFGVRDYDSETGRWTSKEPLGFDGARNFYVYAGNDGVNFVDLDGLEKSPQEIFNINHNWSKNKYFVWRNLNIDFFYFEKLNDDSFFKKMDEAISKLLTDEYCPYKNDWPQTDNCKEEYIFFVNGGTPPSQFFEFSLVLPKQLYIITEPNEFSFDVVKNTIELLIMKSNNIKNIIDRDIKKRKCLEH
jgi:RHS repeat-associated protein